MPDINKLIINKREAKLIAKRACSGQIAGFQMIRSCNCGIFPCNESGIDGECHMLKKAHCAQWPKIAMLPKVEGPFKVTKESRGENNGRINYQLEGI